MDVKKIIDELRRILQNEGISLYFGVSYDSRRNTSPRTVHLMPFSIQSNRQDFCYYDTTFNLRVMVKKEIKERFRDNNDGLHTELINEISELASDVIATINSSDMFLVIQKVNTINFTYTPADMNATAATESSVSFQIPVRIWQLED